jgi:hypothetical protein
MSCGQFPTHLATVLLSEDGMRLGSYLPTTMMVNWTPFFTFFLRLAIMERVKTRGDGDETQWGRDLVCFV